MSQFCRNHLRLVIATLCFLPIPAWATPTITCHCFTERSYDVRRPAAADGYFLATTQNTFFALVFHTDKGGVVIKKQLGASADDLWVSYWLAEKTGASAKTLLQAKEKSQNWGDALAPLRVGEAALGPRFSGALRAKAPAAKLADIALDELFLRYRLLGANDLAAIRQAGVSNQELIIATVVAEKTSQPAGQLYLEVKNGGKTWGSLFNEAKITPGSLRQVILDLLKKQPR